MAKYKMILDLDTGIDDALAIAYALAAPECDLIGIVGSYGNVLVENGAQNSLNLLEMLGHPEVPVFCGLSHSSTTKSFSVMPISAQIHGKNGVGRRSNYIPMKNCGIILKEFSNRIIRINWKNRCLIRNLNRSKPQLQS